MKISKATEVVSHCILCNRNTYETDRRFVHLLGLVEPYSVQRCTSCDLRWLSPRPAPSALRDLYSNENYFGEGDVVERYEDLARERSSYFEKRIIRIESIVRDGSPLAILDVGAATGEFVAAARRRGHQAKGIELSDDARREARRKHGIEIGGNSLEDEPGAACYDVIHMNHVLEHLPAPQDALTACRRLLKPTGLLVIEVPHQFDNDLERLRRLLRCAKAPTFNAYSLHHTYFFTPATLERLLVANGFAVCRLATANPDRTPLRPFSVKNLALRVYLDLSDRFRKGGNIIEVYARLRA